MTEHDTDAPNALAKPLTLRCGAVLPNRLFKSAMTEGMADAHGHATEQHQNLYRAWSHGGTGVLMTGNVMVDHRFLERPGNVIVEDESGLEQLQAWAKAGTEGGNHLWMQISHPGRQCQKRVSKKPMSPSDVRVNVSNLLFGRPTPMTEADIEKALDGYATVAGIAQKAGFTGVQVHGAHGYLCNQFLSPLSNKRDDQWGGSLENRARFLLEAVRRVRAAVGPNFPVAVKLNSADFQRGGFSHEDSIQVAKWLDDAGIDLLELSGGNYEQPALIGGADEQQSESSQAREAYFLHYVKDIRDAVEVPIVLTGGFRSRATMLDVLESDQVDVVGLARPLCTHPDISAGLINGTVDTAPAYEKAHRIGNGYWGPQSSNKTIKGLNFQASVCWYYRQMLHMANNEPLDFELSAGRALRLHFSDEGRLVKARNRALKQRRG